ncbi:cilia- and flagella-associated protein 36-like [Gigantopelta aegis]|uniref:cilia- and flagella-associated protein 36-like n=1 Tax=Gigantopelta aegis TaxID=1735272 RepID=UPI001B88C359|nr:cilia- and flagella-associated protein 36-like [Gigantopelta aegis]
MAASRNEYVLDELICYLSNPLFQVPVISFMENNCIIFEPSCEDSSECKQVHKDYKKMIDTLLSSFLTDTGLSHDQILRALKDLNSKPELRDIFQNLFEQVLAADDPDIFFRLMVQKNIELQQQALMLIVQLQGNLPASLLMEPALEKKALKPDTFSEDDVLKAVLEQSKKEYDADQKQLQAKDEEQVQAIIIISRDETTRLQEEMKREHDKLTQKLATVSIEEPTTSKAKVPDVTSSQSNKTMPPFLSQQSLTDLKSAPSLVSPKDSVTGSSSESAVTAKTLPATSGKSPSIGKPPTMDNMDHGEPGRNLLGHSVQKSQSGKSIGGVVKGGPSSTEAAANWLQSAQTEVQSSTAHSAAVRAMAATMQNLSPEEQKKREEFLKQQRDKLMAMKKKEREKLLLSAERSQPQRPVSARAAHAAMSQDNRLTKTVNPEDEKKLAMRRAIASRIKTELMGKKD